MIPSWTAQYIGIPFLAKGRDRGGCDCWGLARLVWKEQFGLEVPSCLEYENPNDPGEIEGYLAEEKSAQDAWTEIAPGRERLGDGILMRCLKARMHVGLVVAKGMMLHSFAGGDSCVEYYDGPRWKARVLGFYRHKRIGKRE